MTAKNGSIPPNAELLEIGATWPQLAAGTVARATLNGEPVVVVSAKPNALPVIFCPRGWQWLQRWKLTEIRIAAGRVRACGSGRSIGFRADRFLLNAPKNHELFQRNGNLLDLRLTNIASVPRGLLLQAEIEQSRDQNYGADVTLRDGRMRSCRTPNYPSAVDRVAAIMETPPSRCA